MFLHPCQDRHSRHSCRPVLTLPVVLDSVVYPRPSAARKRTPARRISRRGSLFDLGRESPLRKTTSGAYGIGRDSNAQGVAVGCPVSPFFASTARLGVRPGEERAQSPPTVRAMLRIFPRQFSRLTSRFRKNRAWQHSAVASATESRPTV